MARFSDKSIEEIKSKLTIVDVVSDYQMVTNKNGRFWIQCPFHGSGNERTPSCKLDIDRGSFYCFACHEGGSMFDYVMKRNSCTFPESVEILASKAGVKLADATEKQKKEQDESDRLKDLNSRIRMTFSHMLLKDNRGQAALAYLKKRKITDETIQSFNIGFAPADRNWLHSFLLSKGYNDEFLKKSGFFSVNKYPYPLFCNRLMFPVLSWRGETLAFGGRDLTFQDNAPKYLNTPDTLVYSKKHNLFGLYQGLDEIKKQKRAIVCEGNFDVISLHQAGLKIAVAPFGTAFTIEQAKLLSRYVEKVSLLFDSDSAGVNATQKAIIMLQSLGLECEVLKLTDCKDASEMLEKNGEEALKNSLSSVSTGFNYLVETIKNSYNTRTPKGKSGAVKAFLPFLSATNSLIEREEYIKTISDYFDVGINDILHDLKIGGKETNIEEEASSDSIKTYKTDLSQSSISPDLYCMLLFANNRNLFPRYTKRLKFGDLMDAEAQQIFMVLEQIRRDDEGKTDEVFLSKFYDQNVRHDVTLSFSMPEFKSEDVETIIDEILDRMRKRKLEEDRRIIQKQIVLAEKENADEGDIRDLLAEKQVLDEELDEITNRLRGTRTDDDGRE